MINSNKNFYAVVKECLNFPENLSFATKLFQNSSIIKFQFGEQPSIISRIFQSSPPNLEKIFSFDSEKERDDFVRKYSQKPLLVTSVSSVTREEALEILGYTECLPFWKIKNIRVNFFDDKNLNEVIYKNSLRTPYFYLKYTDEDTDESEILVFNNKDIRNFNFDEFSECTEILSKKEVLKFFKYKKNDSRKFYIVGDGIISGSGYFQRTGCVGQLICK